jgi:uroporphyrinogen-III synthase
MFLCLLLCVCRRCFRAFANAAAAAANNKNNCCCCCCVGLSALCRYLQQRGWDVTYLPVESDGRINLAQLQESIRPDTALVSVMAVNNEIGEQIGVWPRVVVLLGSCLVGGHEVPWKPASYGSSFSS